MSISSVASNNDFSSLMQTQLAGGEVGKLEVSAAEVKKAIKNIGEGLKSITVPGKARQMAIDALMKSVSQSERLDPETAEVLTNISSLLTDILAEMNAERNQDQVELEDIFNQVTACNTAGVAADAALEATVNNSEATHFSCRTEEVNKFDTDAATCLILTNFLSQLSQPNCQKPDPTQAAIDSWNTMLHQGASWFTTTKASYEPKRDDCLATTAALEAQVQLCNTDQTSYENHFCEWRVHRVQMCSTLDTCYDAEIAHHINLTQTIKPVADQRTLEAGIIVHVQCLIDKLVQEGNTDHTVCLPVHTENEQLLYNNTYPDPLPTKAVCDTSPVSISPGHNDWYNFAYSTLDAKTPAVSNTGISCIV